MMTMLMLNMAMSLIFIMMNHPLSMGLILLMQTTIISLFSGNLNYNFWYSYILFLIMIGGMLILFMYMTSIASNEKFKLNMKSMIIIPMTLIIMAISNNFIIETNLITEETTPMKNITLMNLSMNKFINYPMNIVLIFMIIYLLLTLIATVKISSFKSGPLRQMN